MVLALPLVIIGLVGLIMAFAYFELGRPTLQALSYTIPFFGSIIGGWLDGALQSAYNAFYSRIASWIQGLEEIFSIPITTIHSILDNQGAASQVAITAVNHLRFVIIPALITNLNGVAYTLYYQAEAYSVTLLDQAVGLIWNRFDANLATIDTLATNLTNLAYTLYYQAQAYSVQLLQQAVGLIWDRFYAGEAFAQSLADGLGAQVAALSTNLQGLIWDRFYTAEADAAAALNAGVSQLEQEVAQAQAQAQANLAAEALTLGGALAIAQVAIQTIEDSSCMKQCATLGNLGQDIAEIADLAFIGALIGWVGASTSNPGGAAQEVQSVLGDLANGAAQAVEAVAGVS